MTCLKLKQAVGQLVKVRAHVALLNSPAMERSLRGYLVAQDAAQTYQWAIGNRNFVGLLPTLGNLSAINNNAATLREGVYDGGGAEDLLGYVTVPRIWARVEAALGAWDHCALFKSHLSTIIESPEV